jgi:hypothetical protein
MEIQDSKEFISGRLPSFASVQETNLAAMQGALHLTVNLNCAIKENI